MKKIIGYLIVIFLVGTMILLIFNQREKATEPIEDVNEVKDVAKIDREEGLKQGDFPPDFELTTLNGDVVKLSELEGKKVILNFWASWCGPCKAEMPHMENFYQNNKEDANVEIIAVNMTTQERRGLEGIEQFVEEYGLTFPIPLDEEGEVIEDYKVITIPTTYMIGSDGKIGHKFVGPMDEKTMISLVESLD